MGRKSTLCMRVFCNFRFDIWQVGGISVTFLWGYHWDVLSFASFIVFKGARFETSANFNLVEFLHFRPYWVEDLIFFNEVWRVKLSSDVLLAVVDKSKSNDVVTSWQVKIQWRDVITKALRQTGHGNDVICTLSSAAVFWTGVYWNYCHFL
jgi:hypothetical protein